MKWWETPFFFFPHLNPAEKFIPTQNFHRRFPHPITTLGIFFALEMFWLTIVVIAMLLWLDQWRYRHDGDRTWHIQSVSGRNICPSNDQDFFLCCASNKAFFGSSKNSFGLRFPHRKTRYSDRYSGKEIIWQLILWALRVTQGENHWNEKLVLLCFDWQSLRKRIDA